MALYSGTPSSVARAGIASATVNGEAIDVSGDCTYNVVPIKQESLFGQSGYQGASQMFQACSIAFTARDADTLDISQFSGMTGASVVVHLVSGKTVSGESLNCVEVGEVKTTDGTFTLKFEGQTVTAF